MSTPPPTPRPAPSEVASPETCLVVLHELLLAADEDGLVTTSARALAARLNLGRATVTRAIHGLLAADTIRVERPGTGAGYPTRYRLREAVRS